LTACAYFGRARVVPQRMRAWDSGRNSQPHGPANVCIGNAINGCGRAGVGAADSGPTGPDGYWRSYTDTSSCFTPFASVLFDEKVRVLPSVDTVRTPVPTALPAFIWVL